MSRLLQSLKRTSYLPILLGAFSSSSIAQAPIWTPPPEGLIPNERAAISIARSVIVSTSSKPDAPINSEAEWGRRFKAELKDGVWTVHSIAVSSSLQGRSTPAVERLQIRLAQRDCRVLSIQFLP